MPELWTLSGINNFSTKAGGLHDYVSTMVGEHLPTRRIFSELGTTPDYPKKRNIKRLIGAEQMLDREAVDIAHANVHTGELASKGVRCLFAGPKTTTTPPDVANLDVEIYWSPDDRVPNQGGFNRDDRDLWNNHLRGNGRLWCVRNRSGRGVGKGHGFHGFMNTKPPIVEHGWRKRAYGKSGRVNVWRSTDQNAPSALDTLKGWMKDSSVDLVLVAHSQGVNIANYILRRGLS